jgi:hypothetical protein
VKAMSDNKRRKLEPLNFSCSTTDCPNGLHAFNGTRTRSGSYPKDTCLECGAALIDWGRVRKQDLGDLDFTVEELKKEYIRHQYWCSLEIDETAINKARRKGIEGTRAAAEHRLRKYICTGTPFRNGMTPYRGNIVHYAQHATGTCCRNCMEQWHNIPKDRDATDSEISYLTELIMRYVSEKLPRLTVNGEYVPTIRGIS